MVIRDSLRTLELETVIEARSFYNRYYLVPLNYDTSNDLYIIVLNIHLWVNECRLRTTHVINPSYSCYNTLEPGLPFEGENLKEKNSEGH